MAFEEEDIKKSRELSVDFIAYAMMIFGNNYCGFVGGSADIRKAET